MILLIWQFKCGPQTSTKLSVFGHNVGQNIMPAKIWTTFGWDHKALSQPWASDFNPIIHDKGEIRLYNTEWIK